MKKPEDTNTPGKKPAPARSALRLVPPAQPEIPASPAIEPLPPVPRRKSNLASFFDAYADAIDRDVKALLDL